MISLEISWFYIFFVFILARLVNRLGSTRNTDSARLKNLLRWARPLDSVQLQATTRLGSSGGLTGSVTMSWAKSSPLDRPTDLGTVCFNVGFYLGRVLTDNPTNSRLDYPIRCCHVSIHLCTHAIPRHPRTSSHHISIERSGWFRWCGA